MKQKDMLMWGLVGVGAVIAVDHFANLGILNSIKSAFGGNKVSYYTPRFSNAYIGKAFGQGQQSMAGDYNGVPISI